MQAKELAERAVQLTASAALKAEGQVVLARAHHARRELTVAQKLYSQVSLLWCAEHGPVQSGGQRVLRPVWAGCSIMSACVSLSVPTVRKQAELDPDGDAG